uniref:LIM zinc-binding domain-containing protein n=1 Tax=Chelydra serpentina TaxID=8475 RepID=A0A8C3XSY3_CHESE
GSQGATPACAGCGGKIRGPFLLRVAPDTEWHMGCLRCSCCRLSLAHSPTCFLRDGPAWRGGLAPGPPAPAQGLADPRPHRPERAAAPGPELLLRGQPSPRRRAEGAAGGADRPQPPRHPGLVPEQALQGQEAEPREPAAAAAPGKRERGPSRDCPTQARETQRQWRLENREIHGVCLWPGALIENPLYRHSSPGLVSSLP